MNKLTLCILISIIVMGCRVKDVGHYPNGNLKYVGYHKLTLKDTIVLDGPQKGYYDNGVLQHEEYCCNGNVFGLQKMYYSNGKLNRTREIYDTKKSGYDSVWYENGKLKSVGHYKNNVPNGCYQEWDTTGFMFLEKNYLNGKENGIRRKWFKDGVKYECTYKDSLKNGVETIWHKNGTILFKVFWNSGNLCGTSYQYDSTGALIKEKKQSINCEITNGH
jgi:antitoxin component YwqK of YwqJK toxin-antitoxin module